jgi:hypothetical protein
VAVSIFNLERHYDWVALVAASGPTGRCWAEEYWQVSGRILSLIESAVDHLREQRPGQGWELLQQACAQREALQETNPSGFLVFGRFIYAGLAYYDYCVEEYQRAEKHIEKAGDCIRLAVEAEGGLLPFAVVCLDMPLKLAHIARSQYRWREMREHIAVARAMAEDDLPLFTDGTGERIYHSTVEGHLKALLDPSEGHGLSLQYLTDHGLRGQFVDALVGRLYAIPGLLIPYP